MAASAYDHITAPLFPLAWPWSDLSRNCQDGCFLGVECMSCSSCLKYSAPKTLQGWLLFETSFQLSEEAFSSYQIWADVAIATLRHSCITSFMTPLPLWNTLVSSFTVCLPYYATNFIFKSKGFVSIFLIAVIQGLMQCGLERWARLRTEPIRKNFYLYPR